MAVNFSKEVVKLLKDSTGLPHEGNDIAERAIGDLDMRKFVSYFLSPYKPKDSLEYMTKELLTMKRGKELQAYCKVVQELMNKSDLRQTIEEFVKNDYDLKSCFEQRGKMVGILGAEDLYWNRAKVKELVRTDYGILKFYCNSVKKTQEIESGSSLLRKFKKFGSTVIEDENYQISKGMVDDMENFGNAKLGIRYDYFDTVKGLSHIKFNTEERWKEIFDWYLHKVKVGVNVLDSMGFIYFFSRRREIFHAKALEYLIERNLPSIQRILEYRKIMDFFLGSTRYTEKIKSSGIPLIYPSFTKEEGVSIKDLYNPCLFLQRGMKKKNIVSNDVESSSEQNIMVITGPNNTGKTVYVKSIGLAYALAQNGFPITARGAQLSELDGIYTHFVHPEDITLGEGSYLDELIRVKDLFQNATPRSLIIVDEPIRGSSPEDAKEMTLRFIKGFITLKAPTFLTTHLHDVASEVDDWKGLKNLQTEMEVDGKELKPTYKIKSGKAGKSYGIEIADKFGLTEKEIQRIVENIVEKKIKVRKSKS